MYQQPSGNPQQQQPQYAYPPLGPNATYQPHSVYQQPIPVPGAQPVATGAVVPVNAPPQSGPFPPQPILASPAPAAAAMPGPAPVQQQVLVRPAAYPQVPTPEMSPIFVAIPETNVITDQGKPFATYTVQFRMGYGLRPSPRLTPAVLSRRTCRHDHNVVFSFTKRFSELLTIHDTLVSRYNLPLPAFPPKVRRPCSDVLAPSSLEV